MTVSWLKFSIEVEIAFAPVVAQHFVASSRFCHDGVCTEEDGAVSKICFWIDEKDKVQALESVQQSLGTLKEKGLSFDEPKVTIEDGGVEEDWRHAWKKYFKTTRLTKRIVVVPSWERFSPTKEDVVINIDPGMAFGTGAHASTQLVLGHMEDLQEKGHVFKTIADVGCGTGILSIAGAKLWPDSVLYANDIDNEALKATLENALKNDVSNQIKVSLDLHTESKCFDLTLANIQAPILIDMSDELLKRSQEQSFTILSGILTKQVNDVTKHFESNGYNVLSIEQSKLDPEWSSIMLKGGS